MIVFGRAARHSMRNPAYAYVLPTVVPLALITLATQVFGAAVALPEYGAERLIDFVGPGILFLGAMMGAGFTATILVTDAASGYLDRLRLLPVSNTAVIAGSLAFEAARMLPVGVCLLAASAALGAPIGTPGQAALVLVLAMAWTAAWNGMFIVAALRTRSAEVVQALMPMFVPFLMTSSLFAPKALMPGYIRAIARVNPLDWLIEAVRPLLTLGAVHVDRLLISGGIVAAVLGVSAVTAARLYGRLTVAD
jgi:ABC-2 type transport system permease protein